MNGFTDFERRFVVKNLNKQSLMDFISKGTTDFCVEELELPHEYKLLRSRLDDVVQIRLIHAAEIIYALDLKISAVVVNKKPCVSVNVWKTYGEKHNRVFFGFADKVFNQILREFNVFIRQRQEPRRFWEYRISNSIKKGIVFFTNADESLSELKPVIDDQAFVDLWFEDVSRVYVISS